MFGDSIVWGAGDPEGGGWVTRLRNWCENNLEDVEVYNLGISADSTNELLRRFISESEARHPDVIVFAIGINDSQYIDSREHPRITPEIFERNLEELIRQAGQFTRQIIFVGLTRVDELKTSPIPWRENTFYENEFVEQYDHAIKSVAEEHKLLYIDVSKNLAPDDLADGLHPNSDGHKKLFEIMLRSLKQYVFQAT